MTPSRLRSPHIPIVRTGSSGGGGGGGLGRLGSGGAGARYAGANPLAGVGVTISQVCGGNVTV